MTTINREPTWRPSDGWLYVESRAIKKKLQGIRVTASNYPEGREVPVGFIGPDFEVRNAEYPGIYLTYGDMVRATDREHRGTAALEYAPSGFPSDVLVPADMEDKENAGVVAWDEAGFDRLSSPYRFTEHPLPYNFVFQIAVLTRNHQQAFEIMSHLSSDHYLHDRWGYLEVPEDGTIRTLELTGGPDVSVIRDEDGKRLVQVLYSVSVSSELNTELPAAANAQVDINRVETINLVVEQEPPVSL